VSRLLVFSFVILGYVVLFQFAVDKAILMRGLGVLWDLENSLNDMNQ
jgi:hypothetical protein